MDFNSQQEIDKGNPRSVSSGEAGLSKDTPETPVKNKKGRLRRGCAKGCGCTTLLLTGVVGVLAFIISRGLPKTYPPVPHPIPPPPLQSQRPMLDGFDSPYIGHTGSWDGKGGAMAGGSKSADLAKEQKMGLRWTFMPVYWSKMEPEGPVDLKNETPAAWRALDAFVIEAHKHRLNILMQAPVIGGNAGGPPAWAGRREKGRSAPANMDAAAAFAAKLVARYSPGGTLATAQGWGKGYGVRAWEMDNEPESYFTCWKGQAGDYAEFVTKVAGYIKKDDPLALIVAPSIAGGGGHLSWLDAALDAGNLNGSPAFRQRGTPYSIGPVSDVVSFHIYEGLDSALGGKDRTVERAFSEVRTRFERWEKRTPKFHYKRKQEYWHTEGNFDFFGLMSPERRAAWRFQFFTRAFAAGIRKVVVMDASAPEQVAVRTYTRILPNPFPMILSTDKVKVLSGQVAAYRHPQNVDGHPVSTAKASRVKTGQVWVIWSLAGKGDAIVEFPVYNQRVEVFSIDGRSQMVTAVKQRVRLHLKGDSKMAPPLIVMDKTKK